MFAWGDSVYSLYVSGSVGIYSKASNELASMLSSGNLVVDVCTTCIKSRGLSSNNLIPGANLSGMHRFLK